jgi:hypothetical protein
MYRGDSYPITLNVSQNSVAMDLTDCSFVMTVDTLQAPPDNTTKLFEVIGILNVPPTDGIVLFTPTTTDTDIDVGKYYYDIRMTDADSNIRTIVKSTLSIQMDITK